MKFTVKKSVALSDKQGRTFSPKIGSVIDLPKAQGESLTDNGVVEPVKPPSGKPSGKPKGETRPDPLAEAATRSK